MNDSDVLEGIIRVMACLAPEVPRMEFRQSELSPTARACGELARFHRTVSKRSNWVEPFAEEPPEDLHRWPTSFFTDSGDEQLQMPMRTTSWWPVEQRGRESWQE